VYVICLVVENIADLPNHAIFFFAANRVVEPVGRTSLRLVSAAYSQKTGMYSGYFFRDGFPDGRAPGAKKISRLDISVFYFLLRQRQQ